MNLVQQSTTKFFLIVGSASRSTDGILLDRAHDFVRALVRSILEAGGGLVVFVSLEPVDDSGRPLVFDWTMLREIDNAHPETSAIRRVVIVTSERVRQEKMNADQRKLIATLFQRGLAEMVNLDDDLITGGNIRDAQAERASAMVALGGGKGVQDLARKLMRKGRPVFPMDLQIGALSEDGEGAIALHRAFMTQPLTFIGHSGLDAQRKAMALSLQEPIQEVATIAGQVVELLDAEFLAEREAAPTDILVLTALPVELQAALMAFGLSEGAPSVKASTGLHYWRAQLQRADGRYVTCSIAAFGNAGNVEAAATTASLLTEFRPKLVVMMGIAAGMRDKCALGDVVISDRVVAYEGAALLAGGIVQSRPETFRPSYSVQQDVTAYLASPSLVRARLTEVRTQHSLELPESSEAGEVSKDVMPKPATIASGEKLLRDPDAFRHLREVHGKVEVAEMEGAGIFAACSQRGAPALVIRGISDFGDTTKDNQFHSLAAQAAAIVAADLARFGLTV